MLYEIFYNEQIKIFNIKIEHEIKPDFVPGIRYLISQEFSLNSSVFGR